MSAQADYDRIDAFLRDLAALTNKHGVAVSGCGCCGSPRISTHLFNDACEWVPVSRDGGRYSVNSDWARDGRDCVTVNNLEWSQP